MAMSFVLQTFNVILKTSNAFCQSTSLKELIDRFPRIIYLARKCLKSNRDELITTSPNLRFLQKFSTPPLLIIPLPTITVVRISFLNSAPRSTKQKVESVRSGSESCGNVVYRGGGQHIRCGVGCGRELWKDFRPQATFVERCKSD